MPKRYGYSFTLAGLMALTVGFAFHADAAFLTFTSQDDWQKAAGNGAGIQYSFDNFAVGSSFAVNTINFGAFRLTAHGTPPVGSDQIMAGDSTGTVNGTPFASMFLDSSNSVVLDFSQPALAFGAEFGGLGLAFNFSVFEHGKNLAVLPGPTTAGYYGIVSTVPFDQIEFQYSGPAGGNVTESFDNVGIASETPAPSTLMMLGIGAAMFAAYSCWRLRGGKLDVGRDYT